HGDAAGRQEFHRLQNVPRASTVRGRHGDFLAPYCIEGNLDPRGRLGRGEEQDGAPAIHASEALEDRFGNTRARDHVVRRKAVVRFPDLRGNVLATVNDRIGSRLPGRGLAVFDDVRRDHLCSAGRLREFHVEETRDAAADDDDRMTRTQTRQALPADDTGERLDEDAFVVRDRLRQREHPMRHVDGRNPHELREASWIEVRRRSRGTSRRAWCAYFFGFAPFTRSSASFGVARSCTMARIPRIMPTGFEDCQMFRPMSTPRAPSWIDSYASSRASSSVSSLG